MDLEITAAAKQRLDEININHGKILLNLDDGVGSFSKFATCAFDLAFNVILVDQNAEVLDYDQQVDSIMGPVAYKGYSKPYLDNHLKLDWNATNHQLQLSGDSGMIDENVQIKDLTTTKVND